MPFNIQNFKQNIADYGYLHGNRFELLVSSPPELFSQLLNNQGTAADNQQLARTMKFRIDNVSVPGINLTTVQQPRYGAGQSQFFPIAAQFEPISFTVILDEFGELWQYWYQWLRLCFDGSGTDSATQGPANKAPALSSSYKDDFSSVCQIVVYDFFGNATQKINFYYSFPTAVSETRLSWNDEKILRLGVTMAYDYYTIVGSSLQSRSSTNNQARVAAERDRVQNIAP